MIRQLDVTKEHCPMTFVKVKLALASMSSGECIEVLIEGDEPKNAIPKAAQEQGHRVCATGTRDGHFFVQIEKGP